MIRWITQVNNLHSSTLLSGKKMDGHKCLIIIMVVCPSNIFYDVRDMEYIYRA